MAKNSVSKRIETEVTVTSSEVSIDTTIAAGAIAISIAVPKNVTADIDGITYEGTASITFPHLAFGNHDRRYPAIDVENISGGSAVVIIREER